MSQAVGLQGEKRKAWHPSWAFKNETVMERQTQ